MGLFDLDGNQTQGLLAAAAALLEAGGPSRVPISTGQGISRGLLGGMGAFNEAKQYKMAEEMKRMQMDRYKQEMEEKNLAREQNERAKFQLQSYVSNLPEGPEKSQIMQAMQLGVPLKDVWKQLNPEAKFDTVYDEKGRQQKAWVTPKGYTPIGGAKQENPLELERLLDAAGITDPMQRANYIRQALTKQTTHAPGTNVVLPKIELKTGESIAGQVGPILKGTREQALSGLKLVDSANRILDAAEKGNLFAGPGANVLMKGAQIADTFGLGGKSTQEKIANTRTVIRGMAEQAVAARSQLGGQAQISNSEQALLDKATSGDIAELTTGEVIQIAQLNDRLGRQLYDLHGSQLKQMEGKPELQRLGGFYRVPPMPPMRKPQGVGGAGKVKFLGFE